MKNTLLHATIGFFIVILGGIGELFYLTNLSNNFINLLGKIDGYESFYEKSVGVANFREIWDKNKKILYMLVDHQDIHKIESILVESELILKNNLNNSQISTNFALLKLYIEDIPDERRFILQNIL